MSNLLKDMDFGNEAGDDADASDLSTYFVEQANFRKFLKPEYKILVATAKKGVGKSALLKWATFNISQLNPDALIIPCRGADFVRSNFNLTSTLSAPNDYIRDWMVRICALVNRHLALRLNIKLDYKDALVEIEEIDSFKSRNLIINLLDRFENILEDDQLHILQSSEKVEHLKKSHKPQVWFLIDDLDATYQNTDKESLELGTFFSACRYLMQDTEDIYFRASMRTDVWALIRRYDESLDKMEQYVFDILWYQEDFLRLLYLRIKSQIEKNGGKLPHVPSYVSQTDAEERLLEKIFTPKMPWAEKMVEAYKVVYTLSYERPRWAIQLCKLAQASALRRHRTTISKDDIDQIWGEYGTKRIADLVAEHKHQCPQIEELITGFRGAEKLMPRDKLFAWINNRILNHLNPKIEGVYVRQPMDVARFLYRLGFIMARSESRDGSYEHYRFDQMPDFLSSRTDDDFGLDWEIHPCYREALDIKKLDRSHKDKFSELRRRR